MLAVRSSAQILAAKQAQEEKLAKTAQLNPTVSQKPKAAVSVSPDQRTGKAQSAQAAQKRIMLQQEREKQALAEQRAAEQEYARANEKPGLGISLPSLSLPSLPF